jgi:hypothetical protein
MINLMVEIGIDNIHYCDTDSLFVPTGLIEQTKPEMLGNELGQLKIQQKNVDIMIRGVKNYDIKKSGNLINRKIKGIKKGAVLISENEDTLTFRQQQWLRLKSTVRKQLPLHQQVIKSITKEIKKQHPKGILDTKTGRVKPYG